MIWYVQGNSVVRFGLYKITSFSGFYGNPDCQASEGFAKHVAEGNAEDYYCNQTFSKQKGPRRPQDFDCITVTTLFRNVQYK